MDLVARLPKCETCEGPWDIDKIHTEKGEDEHIGLYIDLSCPKCGEEKMYYFTLEQLVLNTAEFADESEEEPTIEAELDESEEDRPIAVH